MADEKKVDVNNEHLNIKVLGLDNNYVQIKIKKDTPFIKLMNAYCDRENIKRELVQFRYEGEKIQDDYTATKLEMEEGDVIQVFSNQDGGML